MASKWATAARRAARSKAGQGRALLEAMGFSKEELEEHGTDEDAREHLGRNLVFTYGSEGGKASRLPS